ncbi:uncharacterized protein Z518_10597 [Rhinocladiella mackenziei CBS 650.93]|uniref:Uncharacterized protein n=1 Tax=Rhinocladiella mackenziei CBS 650.93 TaxID=1442369 RepID=A0A0D2FEI2_9EURO|nr:uncharacterized protein Z518_10597 [Rhinocladiella mackenziei CBS 650.93]KIX00457.1 hypothetical protein Z518_10597 [Rhinocladiella mackenziei CBS 650.93]
MSMDEEGSRLQLYVAGQVLSISTLLQLLERENAQRREFKQSAHHQEVMTKLDHPKTAISGVQQNLGIMTNPMRIKLDLADSDSSYHWLVLAVQAGELYRLWQRTR